MNCVLNLLSFVRRVKVRSFKKKKKSKRPTLVLVTTHECKCRAMCI